MVFIAVYEEKCTGCEECVIVCPRDVFVMENNKSVPANIERCIECCSCVEVCPVNAIYVDACLS